MSAVAEHAWTNQHQPLWGNVRVLDTATNKTILTIKEAMHIHMAKSSSSSASSLRNRDCGVPVADCWKPILNRACHATPTFHDVMHSIYVIRFSAFVSCTLMKAVE